MMKTLLILALAAGECFAAISAQQAINVRTDGASTNGGGFVYGATGTNYSLFPNKNAAGCSSCGSSTVDLSTTDGVANGSTTYTSATANFGSTIVGNVVYFSGGTGSIAAVRREVTARASTTSITLDASIASSTGMTMNIGGAVDSPATALLFNTAGNRIFVMFGTYTTTATFTLNNSRNTSSTAPYNYMTGYSSTYGDCTVASCAGGRPSIVLSTNTGLACFAGDAAGWVIQNFICNCSSLGNSQGIKSGAQNYVVNNKVMNYTTWGIDIGAGQDTTASDNEITGGTSASTGAIHVNARGAAIRNYIHGNDCTLACQGMINGTGTGDTFEFNLIVANDNSTHSIPGIGVNTQYNMNINFNTIDGHQDSISISDPSLQASNIRGNLLTNATRYCLTSSNATAYPAFPNYDGNAFFNCATANRHNIDDTGTAQAVDAAGPYTNVYDVQLTVSPYVGGGDWTLNPTAGGGQAAKGTALPGVVGGISGLGTGYQDFGAFHSRYGTGSAGGSNSAYAQ